MYPFTPRVYVNEKPLIPVVVQSFIGTAKPGSIKNFERPKLARNGFSVLKAAKPTIKKLAQKDT
jgi:hypothetical protein